MPTYKVTLIRRSDGEFHPVLLSDDRPLVLPNLWADDLAISKRPNTVRSYLEDLAVLYRLAGDELESLDVYRVFFSAQRIPKAQTAKLAKAISYKNDGSLASAATQQRRYLSLRAFLEFASGLYLDLHHIGDLEVQAQAHRNIQRTKKALSKLSISGQSGAPTAKAATALTSASFETISLVMHPLSELNPFKSKEIRFRNYCILHVAFELWARRAEIALLELSDCDFSEQSSINIKRPTRAVALKRKDGASLKTSERKVPISKNLASLLHEYVENVRDHFLVPRRPTTALFISSRDGRRLSSATLNLIFSTVHRVPEVSNLVGRLHPHGLRATGANDFRRGADQERLNGSLSEIALHDCLLYMGGWSRGSAMPRHYTRDAIFEKVSRLRLT